MRRLIILIGAFVFLAACGHGKERAGIPTSKKTSTAKVSKSELEGIASYYAEPYNGRRTANGEIFDTYNAMTAAHKTLPFNTVVRVKNLKNGEEVDVRINDRGPFVKGRIIDLSLAAAKEIDLARAGIAPVKLQILKEGSPVSKITSKPASPAAVPAPVAAAAPPPAAPAPVRRDTAPVPVAAAPASPLADVPTPLPQVFSEVPFYAVQVGAFQSESAADKLRGELAARYSDVSVQPPSANQALYRVRVGKVSDMDSAEQIAKKLSEEHFNTFVVRTN